MNYLSEDDFTPTDEKGFLMHYGTKRHSGRYPWGSGENPYQHSGDFLSRIYELRKQGLTDNEIAEGMGLNTSQFRTQKSLALSEQRALMVEKVRKLKDKGYTVSEIGRMVGKNESSVRSLLNEATQARMNKSKATAELLKKELEKKGMLDVGAGVERELGVSSETMKNALYILEMEGYNVYGRNMAQVTNQGKYTTLKVLTPPGTEHKDVYKNIDDIKSVTDYISYDGGDSFRKSFVYPESMDLSRLKIRYADDGGDKKDGLIELRRGVDDLSLGESKYAQVRIMVDNDRYIKGMAVYSDNMPDGVDVIFNTNKRSDVPVRDVLKKIKDDPDNPFGSLIKERGGQSYYDDPNGKYADPVTGKKQSLSLINKRAEEGDWDDWSDSLPSQFLAKQNLPMIRKQLKATLDDKQREFDEICSLTNPTVKKKLLDDFADDCDAAAVHLQAAALPRQTYKVILPGATLKDDEVYAPTYEDGEKIALIRFPHGGTFEIPILTVNNKQREGKKMIGADAEDAVVINKNVADRLSGADFDGDTVMTIPTAGNGKNLGVNIKSSSPLKGLEGFDPKERYPEIPGMKYMTKANTQTEMGKISNLITDMTIKGATDDEKARAVRHSMVVIDAEKHHLNYKQSEIDNGIQELKNLYQGGGGASTLISMAKSEERVTKRVGTPKIDPETGELIYKTSPETYVDKKTGKVKERMSVSTKMAETRDAHTLSSGTPVEEAYADYANGCKALANKARKESVSTSEIKYNTSAHKTYSSVCDKLDSQLKLAELNAPKERQAQRLAASKVAAKKEANPDMTKAEIKKANQQALTEARNNVGAKRTAITIDDESWNAIQSGAVPPTKLKSILKYADMEDVRRHATPRSQTELSQGQKNRISSMNLSGYTNSEIAAALGVSPSTVAAILKNKN
ncbi:MAG: helix-turn-helix domain-containing protein [Ruminococcus sp.]|nr:helix-turn-helix domain-containing protein [Ruminococcus sp.]